MQVICRGGEFTIIFTKLKKMWKCESFKNDVVVEAHRVKEETVNTMVAMLQQDRWIIVRR